LRKRAMPVSPPASLPTTLLFHARSASRSTFGSPKAMPCSERCLASSMIAATCSSALEGMQPTLRQTPPSVG
jgi:hypothetical protein